MAGNQTRVRPAELPELEVLLEHCRKKQALSRNCWEVEGHRRAKGDHRRAKGDRQRVKGDRQRVLEERRVPEDRRKGMVGQKD